jgi:nitrite reductase (NO-forming)
MKAKTMKAKRHILCSLFALTIAGGVLVQPPAIQAAPTVADVAKDPTDVPPPINRSNPQTVTVDLYVEEVIAEHGFELDGVETPAWIWTFNGTVPSPMIRVMEGDTVVINLHNCPRSAGQDCTGENENIEPHNIDFHASMGPGGGADVTNIEPNETRTFSFKALRQGAYIYHCAGEGAPWEHVAYGMYGLIMVEPKGGLSAVDKEFYIAQSDWYFKPNDGVHSEIPDDVLILDEDKAFAEHPDMYSFNGHKTALVPSSGPFGETTRSDQGDSVRFFFVTGGPNIGSNWHIIGTIFDKVYKGHLKDFIRNEETVYVPPGSAAVFDLQTPVPGEYLIVDHALFRVPQGALGILHVDPVGPFPLDIYSPDPSSL